MVQKSVFAATNPNTNARTNPPAATQVRISVGLDRFTLTVPRRPTLSRPTLSRPMLSRPMLSRTPPGGRRPAEPLVAPNGQAQPAAPGAAPGAASPDRRQESSDSDRSDPSGYCVPP